MRDNKNRLFIDISVESNNDKEDSPYPAIHQEEQVHSATKKVKFYSTVTEKFKRSDTPNQDFVVGRDMNLAKQISIENFRFITKATPQGFHTAQISEDKRGTPVYREHKFALYFTEEEYPKYTRFVLTTFLFLYAYGTRERVFLVRIHQF
jgi:hypothetical protein